MLVEPRKASVALHYRPDRLKVMLGKMVYELQPKIGWANADDLEIADRAAAVVLLARRRLCGTRSGLRGLVDTELTNAVRIPVKDSGTRR